MAAALVLKKFTVDSEAADGEFVHIVGRQPGLIAFFLSVMRIDPTTMLRCNADRVEFKQASFFGERTLTIPLKAVTGISGGHTKPVGYLAAAGLFGMFALSSIGLPEGSGFAFGVCLFIALVCLGLYVLKKQMGLHVQNGGDVLHGMEFNSSVIEGVDVDAKRVDEAVRLINWAVLHAKR